MKTIKNYHTLKLSQLQIDSVNEFNNNTKIKFEKISCLICGSSNHKILFTNERHGLNQKTVLCKKCGLIFSNPRMSQSSTEFFYASDLYRNIYNEGGAIEYIKRRYEDLEKNPKRPFFDIINSLNIKYQSVCEIGASGGVNLKVFKLAGKDVVGYEPSESLSNFAKTKGINVINGSVDDVKGQYDLVILIQVFEHLLNPIDVLKKLKKNVKKYLFIEVPGCITKFSSIQNAHNFYFSLNTLSYVVTQCGYKIRFIDYKQARVNDIIYALFEKTDKLETCHYDFAKEAKKFTRIYYKYSIKIFIKRLLRKILEKINPNIEKKIINIIDLRGS